MKEEEKDLEGQSGAMTPEIVDGENPAVENESENYVTDVIRVDATSYRDEDGNIHPCGSLYNYRKSESKGISRKGFALYDSENNETYYLSLKSIFAYFKHIGAMAGDIAFIINDESDTIEIGNRDITRKVARFISNVFLAYSSGGYVYWRDIDVEVRTSLRMSSDGSFYKWYSIKSWSLNIPKVKELFDNIFADIF